MVERLEIMTNTNGSSNVKGGNVTVNIDGKHKEGYYIGSATNVARLFIAVSIVFGVCVGYLWAQHNSFKEKTLIDYYNLEKRVVALELLAR